MSLRVTDTSDEIPDAPPPNRKAPEFGNNIDEGDAPAAAPSEYRRGEKGLLLTVAALSAVTGILGAAVGGYFGYRGSSAQRHAAAVLAERQELKDAYSQYFTKLDDLNDLVFELGEGFKTYTPADRERLTAKIGEYDAAWAEWGRLDDIMLLLSSREVVTASENVTESENKIHDTLDSFKIYMQEGKTDEILNGIAEYYKTADVINSMEDAFFDVAKKDLTDLGYGG